MYACLGRNKQELDEPLFTQRSKISVGSIKYQLLKGEAVCDNTLHSSSSSPMSLAMQLLSNWSASLYWGSYRPIGTILPLHAPQLQASAGPQIGSGIWDHRRSLTGSWFDLLGIREMCRCSLRESCFPPLRCCHCCRHLHLFGFGCYYPQHLPVCLLGDYLLGLHQEVLTMGVTRQSMLLF